MKRFNAFPFLLIPLLFGCASPTDSSKISVVCTSFAPFDWVSTLLKGSEKTELVLLNDNGLDPHSYEPTVRDISRIAKSDFFVYIGGESEAWVENALKQSKKENRNDISLLNALGDKAKQEEQKEGMEGEEEEGALDEHVWLSLKNASFFVGLLSDALIAAVPEEKDLIQRNAEAYRDALDTLDRSYEEAVKQANQNTLVFADRFPFRYLVDDYQLDYYAAFSGCSAESEASFQTILFLAKQIDALGLSTILKIETSDDRLANTVREATTNKNQTIRTLDSMQSKKTSDNQSFLSVMESNLTVLKEALR